MEELYQISVRFEVRAISEESALQKLSDLQKDPRYVDLDSVEIEPE